MRPSQRKPFAATTNRDGEIDPVTETREELVMFHRGVVHGHLETAHVALESAVPEEAIRLVEKAGVTIGRLLELAGGGPDVRSCAEELTRMREAGGYGGVEPRGATERLAKMEELFQRVSALQVSPA